MALYDIGEPYWAAELWKRAKNYRGNGDSVQGMLQSKCGYPVTTNCQIRDLNYMSDTYLLTHRESGEQIKWPSTIEDWLADM